MISLFQPNGNIRENEHSLKNNRIQVTSSCIIDCQITHIFILVGCVAKLWATGGTICAAINPRISNVQYVNKCLQERIIWRHIWSGSTILPCHYFRCHRCVVQHIHHQSFPICLNFKISTFLTIMVKLCEIKFCALHIIS